MEHSIFLAKLLGVILVWDIPPIDPLKAVKIKRE